jgi:hypothetical protein
LMPYHLHVIAACMHACMQCSSIKKKNNGTGSLLIPMASGCLF